MLEKQNVLVEHANCLELVISQVQEWEAEKILPYQELLRLTPVDDELLCLSDVPELARSNPVSEREPAHSSGPEGACNSHVHRPLSEKHSSNLLMEPEEALKVMRHYITRVRDLDHISPESLNNSEQLEERHIDSVPIYHTHSANLRGELDQIKRQQAVQQQQAAPEEVKENGAARANLPENI